MERFDTTGILTLRGAIPRADAGAMAARLWAEMERRFGMRRDAPETWTTVRPAQFQLLERSDAFAAMNVAPLREALDDLFGAGEWEMPAHWGQVLATFPSLGGVWDVPHQNWHLDAAPVPDRPLPSVRAFALLAPLKPGQGGTVYLEGSHILFDRFALRAGGEALRSSWAKRELAAAHPWLADLWSGAGDKDRIGRFMHQGTTIDGVDLRVAELTGEAGDVFIMHPGVFHTIAPNVRAAPRLMLMQAVHRG